MSHFLSSLLFPYECQEDSCDKKLASKGYCKQHDYFRIMCRKCGTAFGPPRGWTDCYNCRTNVYQLMKDITMTPDDFYQLGYEDGKASKAMNASHMTNSDYMMGYEDGKGDAVIQTPSADEFDDFNDPPEGFEFTGSKRVPAPYEFYLSKGGKATVLARERKNSQTRHILRCAYCHQIDSSRCFHHRIKARS